MLPRRRLEGEPVVVTGPVLAGIETVRRVGSMNMLDRAAVAGIARALGYEAAADWIQANPATYAEGIFRSFQVAEVEFNWNAPLIDEDNNLHHADCVGDEVGDDDD